MTSNTQPVPDDGRPVVFRNATVLTMTDAHDVHHHADLLVIADVSS